MILLASVQLLVQSVGPDRASPGARAKSLGAAEFPADEEWAAAARRRPGSLARWLRARRNARDLRSAIERLDALAPHLLDDIGMAARPGRPPTPLRGPSDRAEEPEEAPPYRMAAE